MGFLISYTLIELYGCDSTDLSLRDYCIINYAETVLNDPGQWMIAVDYLQSCGDIGLRMADEVVARVPLKTSSDGENSEQVFGIPIENGLETNATIIPSHVMRFCREHGREWVSEAVIRVRPPSRFLSSQLCTVLRLG